MLAIRQIPLRHAPLATTYAFVCMVAFAYLATFARAGIASPAIDFANGAGGSTKTETAPRIAIWDPETDTEAQRFSVSATYLRNVAMWLQQAKIDVELLTAKQIATPSIFNARRFDALMVQGGVVPADDVEAYRRFMMEGGILIALSASSCFEIRIEQDADGNWRLSPEEPKFAWQLSDIHEALGLDYRTSPAMINAGVQHVPTALLSPYLSAPMIERPLSARWLVPKTAKFFPLIRSYMAGGEDYTPQIMLCVNGNSRAILCSSGFWTGAPEIDQIVNIGGQFRSMAFRPGGEGSEAGEWSAARELVVAFARFSGDLRAGRLKLSEADAVCPAMEVVKPPLYDFRGVHIGVDPEGIHPIFRLGRFDGSNGEYALNQSVPGCMEPTTSLTVQLPVLSKPAVLRFRGAVPSREEAVLRLALETDDGRQLDIWNERLVWRDTDDRYVGASLEFTRLVYLPPLAEAAAPQLVVSNLGTGRLLLDALQVEPLQRGTNAPAFEIGAHTSTALAYDGKIHGLTAARCKDWSTIRCTTRVWWIDEPSVSNSWERFDRHVERYLALHPRPQFILEGTPRWAALNERRWLQGGRKPHMAVPDLDKYAALVERIVSKYGSRVQDWEVGNETSVHGFWNGTPGEYTAFFKRMASIIRQRDPSARIISAGMAGVTQGTIDPFILAMSKSGALAPAWTDLFGVHCYRGRGMWDIPFGLAEGHLFALGENVEIFANEQGTELGASVSLDQQAEYNSRGMARLFASGLTKLILFQSDSPPNSSAYGILDHRGNPRPAYAPFEDYLKLAQKGGRRTPVSMTSPAGSLSGVYAAAATHEDGTMTIVLNPIDVDAFLPRTSPEENLLARSVRGRWVNFFGSVKWNDADGTNVATFVSESPSKPMGFFCKTLIDVREQPELIVSVAETSGPWKLMLKHGPDKTTVHMIEGDKPGVFHIRLDDKLPQEARQDLEISFRSAGRFVLNGLRLPMSPNFVPVPPAPVTVTLAVPLPEAVEVDDAWEVRDPAGARVPCQIANRTLMTTYKLSGQTVLRLSRP